MDCFRDVLVRATGWGQGGQFGHSRAGVRYFHREPTRESSNLQRGGPRSLYFPQPAHNTAPFNLLKILYPDTKLHGHATVETTSKKLACSFWITLSYEIGWNVLVLACSALKLHISVFNLAGTVTEQAHMM